MKVKLLTSLSHLNFGKNDLIPSSSLASLTSFLRKNNHFVSQEDLNVKCWNDNNNPFISRLEKIDPNIFTNSYQKWKDYILGKNKDIYYDLLIDRLFRKFNYDFFDYDLVGFSVISWRQLLSTLAMAKKIKEKTKTKIVLGGSYLTLICDPTIPNNFLGEMIATRIMKEYSFIDYIIIGDGEIPLLELTNILEKGNLSHIKKIPGLIFRDKNKIKINNKIYNDINSLPPPDFEGLPLEKYNKPLTLPYQINKGCPFKCSFCTFHPHHKIQLKSPEKVVKELDLMIDKYGTNKFMFTDNLVNLNYEHISKICDKIINSNLNIIWDGSARLDNLDRKLLYKMKKSGCISLACGLESGSQNILENMNKKLEISKVEKVLKNSKEVGPDIILNFIVGYPHESESEFNETIDFIKRNHIYFSQAIINGFCLYRPSLIYNNPKKFGVENLRPTTDDMFEFMFDEINGYKWDKKIVQIEDRLKKIYIVLKSFGINVNWPLNPKIKPISNDL